MHSNAKRRCGWMMDINEDDRAVASVRFKIGGEAASRAANICRVQLFGRPLPGIIGDSKIAMDMRGIREERGRKRREPESLTSETTVRVTTREGIP
jgi:hypothetical protein